MKNRRGFTLVELLVVMVILGIITGLSIPLIRNIQESNKKKQYTTYMDSVKYASKLYVDSYQDDLFGHQKSGCAIIPYSWMEEKGLLKDIQIDKVSCASNNTFVKVVKLDDKYGYAVSIGCGTKKADGTVQIETKIPEESVADMSTCSVDATTIMSFSASPNKSESLTYQKRNITVSVKSDTGINTNADIEYGFSATDSDNPTIIGGWKKLPISVTGLNSQKQSILNGGTITLSSSTIQTDTYTGTLYLYIKVNTLEDLSGRSWTTNPEEKSIKKLGSYVLDNTKPEFNDSTVVSSESGYNSIKPKLNLKVTDKLSSTADLKMCISYDTDTCKKTVKEIKAGTGYEKYSATKVLSQIQSNYDGSSHKIYVTVADPAGNYTTKTFNYDLAYQITYNANGGTGTMNPTYCNKNVDCTLRTNTFKRTGFDYLGFYTAASGGTKYGTTTKLTKNITVYAQWKVHVCTITYNPNGGTFTSNATATTQTCDYSESGANCTNDMRNANGGHYSATRTGYSIVSGKEWIDGTRTFDQAKGYKATDFCPDLATKNQSVTLKVNWKINTYTLTYNSNGGSVCSQSTVKKQYNNEWGTLCTPTRKGYTFKGWKDESGNTITSTTKATRNLTVYAQWAVHVCTITYDPNGGTFTSNATATTQTCNYSESGANCTNDMRNANGGHYSATRKGYSIVSGKEWINGTKTFDQAKGYKATDFCSDLATKDQSVTLKVNWSVVNYTISYTLNGGSVTGNPTTYNINTNTITLKNPSKSNSSFTGWTGSNGTTRQTTVTIPKGSTGNKTYTANWDCESGYYISGGVCSPCEKGYYCPDKVNRKACPKGTYNDKTLQTASSACKSCGACKTTDGTAKTASSACQWNYGISTNYNTTAKGYKDKIGVLSGSTCYTDVAWFWGKFRGYGYSGNAQSSGNWGFEDWFSESNRGYCNNGGNGVLSNYGFERYILSLSGKQGFTDQQCNVGPLKNKWINPVYNKVALSSGTKQYSFSPISGAKTIFFQIRNGGGSSSITVSGLKFNINGSYYTLKQMVENGYVKPLVLVGSFAVYGDDYGIKIYSGGSQGDGFYPDTMTVFMLNSGYTLNGFEAYQSSGSSIAYDDGYYLRVFNTSDFGIVLK